MPTPTYSDTKEKLIEDMRSSAGSGTRQFDIAKAILEIKAQEEVAKQTDGLRAATWVLALSTIGLVVATIALAIISIMHGS